MNLRNIFVLLPVVGIASVVAFETTPWKDANGAVALPVAAAATTGEDNRAPLSESKSTIGFSDADAARANACTGIMICEHDVASVQPGEQCEPGSFALSPTECVKLQTASASLICPAGQRRPDGSCAADTIATAAHAFNAVDAPGVKEDRCYFQTYPLPRQGGEVASSDIAKVELPAPIGDVSASTLTAPTKEFLQQRGLDRAFVHLITPITGCDPYNLTPADEMPAAGDTIVMLTQAQQGQDPTRFDDSQPVAYPCTVLSRWKVDNAGSTIFFTNCAAGLAASGGAALVRAKSGDWTVAAILSGTVPDYGVTFEVGTDGALPGSDPRAH
jgi:hypothetical protein